MRAASVVLVALSVSLSESLAFADGHVFGAAPPPVVREEIVPSPVIPDQRALLVQRGGRETLVIETAFSGRGTDFAWVVPTPSVPAIEQVSPDLFPSLAKATQPELVSRVPDLKIAGLCGIAIFLMVRHGAKRGRRTATVLLTSVACVALLGPAGGLGSSNGNGSIALAGVGDVRLPSTPQEELVSVKQREVIGAYDAVTIRATDAHALAAWLQVNGYAVPAGMEDVAAAYVRDGWVFNAMRLHRDADGGAAVRIHPLAFTFDTQTLVYPMRLTGVATGPVQVQLFVAGDRRATADGFETVRCGVPTPDMDLAPARGRVRAESVVAELVSQTRVLTQLDRTFDPEAMKEDVTLGWTKYASEQPVVLSERAAAALAWNAATLLAIAGLIALVSCESAARAGRRASPLRRWTATALVLFAASDAGLLIGALAPTAPTRPVVTSAR